MMQQEELEKLKELMALGGIDGDALRARYDTFSRIDDDQAMARLRERITAETTARTVPMWHRWAVAASIVTLLAIGALVWWRQYTKIVPPAISEEVLLAMSQSQKSGHQGADVEEFAIPATTILTQRQRLATHGKQGSPRQKDAVEQLLAAKRITTRSDKEFWLTLPDGSLVHLNYNTHVIYPEKFTSDTRDVILDGEAYFMVAKDRRHPFIVHTPHGDVKEYGTEFNVSTRSGTDTEVVLVEGNISVTPANGQEQMLHPSQKCSISNAQCSMSEVDVEPYVAWNTGKFVFEDATLSRIMEVVGRWYGYNVRFDNPEACALTLTGKLDRYDELENTLKALHGATGRRIEQTGNNIVIY